MKSFFEYFYYRMYKLNRNNSYEIPSLGLTATQFILFINIVFFLIKGPLNIRGKSSEIEIIILILLFFGLDFYNNKIYKGKFEEFDKKWGGESKRQKTIGMLNIILFILFSWGFIFINAYIFDRYK